MYKYLYFETQYSYAGHDARKRVYISRWPRPVKAQRVVPETAPTAHSGRVWAQGTGR